LEKQKIHGTGIDVDVGHPGALSSMIARIKRKKTLFSPTMERRRGRATRGDAREAVLAQRDGD